MLRSRQISGFCSQMKLMLASGAPLLESIKIITSLPLYQKKSLKWQAVIGKINEGNPFSEAVKGVLPPLVVSSLRSAENAGSLEATLDQLAKFYQNRAEVEEKLKAALVYPCFVITLSVLVMIAVFFFVLPGFNSLFADLGSELPLFTRIVLNLSSYWYVLLIIPLLGLLLRHRWAQLPLINKLYNQELIIQMISSLGALLSGGVPIMEALNGIAQSTQDGNFRRVVINVVEKVESGEKLSAALAAGRFFPPEVLQLVQVGENSGRLADMLLSSADLLTHERESYLKKLTALIEPAMTLSVGIVVAVVVLAMFLPLINMVSSLQ